MECEQGIINARYISNGIVYNSVEPIILLREGKRQIWQIWDLVAQQIEKFLNDKPSNKHIFTF